MLEPFATYRLAEIHQRPGQFEVQTDYEFTWFYLIKAASLNNIRYTKDVLLSKTKLLVYINNLDPSLINSLRLIDKYEHKDYAPIVKYCFKLVFSPNHDENGDLFLSLLNSI